MAQRPSRDRKRRSAATIWLAVDAGDVASCQRAPHASLSRPFAAAVPTWTLALRPDVVRGWAAGALAAADVASAGASRRAVADGAAHTATRSSRLRCACVWVLCARPQRRAPAEPAR